MSITVLVFGHYRDAVPEGRITLDLSEKATVADVADELAARDSRLHDLLTRTRYAINAEFVNAASVLQEGDELAFLPPMSGG